MTQHRIGTAQEHLDARLALLEAEKEHTRRGDELAGQRHRRLQARTRRVRRPLAARDARRARHSATTHRRGYGPHARAGAGASGKHLIHTSSPGLRIDRDRRTP